MQKRRTALSQLLIIGITIARLGFLCYNIFIISGICIEIHDRKEGSVMKTFQYTIKDEVGLHARPASRLVMEAKRFAGTAITLQTGDKSANLTKIMAVMALGVKCGDTVTITAEGPDEDAAADAIRTFLEENL